MQILSIHAHPDDAEIMAGGTLALLSQLGHRITIVTMTNGDCGSAERDPEAIAAIRKAEAAASAALIGASYRWGGCRDLSVFNDDATRRAVCGLMREIRPQLVLTASPVDYHCDHEATSVLVRDACFAASVPNYKVPGGGAPLEAIPHLYYMDSIDGVDREGHAIVPGVFIDVGSSFVQKRSMLACHDSQRNWLKTQHGIDDYLAQMEQWTRARGRLCGVEFAEGFRIYPGHPYPQTPLLEELLERFVVKSKLS
ncbi:MAG TPA: PIG-L family deacetylase [Bryobacteraceae bacterium]|jgi:LmbE family N-acetylglucosaminyl deacetylase